MSCLPISSIRDWSDGFITIKRGAEDARGALEAAHPGHPQRWPRTTGADALAIVDFLDPHVRRLVAEDPYGSALLDQSWRACLADLQRWGAALPHGEYTENRRFWSHVLTAAVHLSASAARLPTRGEWEQVLSALRRPLRHTIPRDVPFGPFDGITAFDALYLAQLHLLQVVRGTNRLLPEPGMTGGERAIPRTTNADVKQLRAFWGHQFDHAAKTVGYDVERRWRAASADVHALAEEDPAAEYPKNNAFWRALSEVAAHVHVAACAVGDSPRNGIPRDVPFGPFEGITAFDDLYLAHVRLLQSKRGADRLAPELGMTGGDRNIPRTTNADVIQLRDFWGHQLSNAKKIIGHEGVAKKWAAASADVEALAKRGDPSAVYLKNNAFWRTLSTVATQVHVASRAPGKAEQIADSIKVGVTELPNTLGKVATGAGEVARDVVTGAGSVVGGLFRSIFGVGPLWVGGGLLAAYLMLRRNTSPTTPTTSAPAAPEVA